MRSGSLGFEQVISCFLWGEQCCSLVLQGKNAGRKKHRDNEITGRKQALLQNNTSKFQKLLILRSRARKKKKVLKSQENWSLYFRPQSLISLFLIFKKIPLSFPSVQNFKWLLLKVSFNSNCSVRQNVHTPKEAFVEERDKAGTPEGSAGGRAGTAPRQSPWWGWWAHSPPPRASQRPS